MTNLKLTTSLAHLPAGECGQYYALLHQLRGPEHVGYFVVRDDGHLTLQSDYDAERVEQGHERVFAVHASVLPSALDAFVEQNMALVRRIGRGLFLKRLGRRSKQAKVFLQAADAAAQALERACEELRADQRAHSIIWSPIELFNPVAAQFLGRDDDTLARALQQLLGDAGYFECHGRTHWCDPAGTLEFAKAVRNGTWPVTCDDDHHFDVPVLHASSEEVRAYERNLQLLFGLAFPGVRITVAGGATPVGPHLALLGVYLNSLTASARALSVLRSPRPA